NGLSMDLVYQRVKRGWGKEKALSTPPQSNKRTADDTTLLEIGRKKYLNRTEFKDAPLPFFPSELKALKQRGLTLDDVAEVRACKSMNCRRGTAPLGRGRYTRLQK